MGVGKGGRGAYYKEWREGGGRSGKEKEGEEERKAGSSGTITVRVANTIHTLFPWLRTLLLETQEVSQS